MVSIDTIARHNDPVRTGYRSLPGVGAAPARAWLKNFVTFLRVLSSKHRTRMHLRDLTDDQLRDIGVTRAEAQFEADKPFWWYRG